ncbi:hypothetical protein [Desulfoluna sp.]|uniref:hypothetical protein n=1 Tax=Desulfoluna sp. TaxID=2045199 RepID=UPI002623B79B|nr:hypothetical protein [Desulfoluna sp.]
MARLLTGKGDGAGNGTRMCTSLLLRLAAKGYSSGEINRMVKDVFEVIRDGGSFTVAIVNTEMEGLGWPPSVFDESTFDMIVGLFESELGFSVVSHTVN